MNFTKSTGEKVALKLDSLKLTKGLQTTLFLNGLGFWNLQPTFAFLVGGEKAFCKAWAIFMKEEFDVESDRENSQKKCEAFYEKFDFSIVDKAKELTELITKLVDRDIEPVKELAENVKTKKSKARKR